MKRFYTAALMLLLFLASCSRSPEALRTGDLVFVGIPMTYTIGDDSMADAIGAATGGDSLNIIHTAIAEVSADSVWIIDATLRRGVDRHPLDTFLCDFTLKDGSLPRFIVMRLKDDTQAREYVENAKRYLGLKYNNAFIPCDTAKYCTELVRDSYIHSDGSHIFRQVPMNFKAPDGTMPRYWEELFAILGTDVPQDEPGTNPNQIMHEAALERVDIDITAGR